VGIVNKIKNYLAVRCSISVIVIGSMTTAFAAEEPLSSKCHGVYSKAGSTVSDPVVTIPVFDPVIEDVNVFEGKFTLINAEKDFIIKVTNKEQFNFVKQIEYIDLLKADCYAEYDWQTDTFEIPYVYLPSVVVPMGDSQDGSYLNI
jgi:hypothetical protein